MLCCQELYAFGQWRQETLLATAGKLGFKGFACSPNASLLGGWGALLGDWAATGLAFAPNVTKWIDGGIVILSRHPVVETRTMEFTRSSGGDIVAGKGPVYVQIQHPVIGAVHVFSMHLQASENLREKDGATASEKAIRASQIGELLSFLRDCVGGDPAEATVLLAGDWNIDAHAHRSEEKSLPGGLAEGVGFKTAQMTRQGSAPGSPPSTDAPSSPPGGSPEYQALLSQLRSALPNLRDLVQESAEDGFHPVTYGALRADGEPVDKVLTEKEERGCQAFVDYVFLSQPSDAERAKATAGVDRCDFPTCPHNLRTCPLTFSHFLSLFSCLSLAIGLSVMRRLSGRAC